MILSQEDLTTPIEDKQLDNFYRKRDESFFNRQRPGCIPKHFHPEDTPRLFEFLATHLTPYQRRREIWTQTETDRKDARYRSGYSIDHYSICEIKSSGYIKCKIRSTEYNTYKLTFVI